MVLIADTDRYSSTSLSSPNSCSALLSCSPSHWSKCSIYPSYSFHSTHDNSRHPSIECLYWKPLSRSSISSDPIMIFSACRNRFEVHLKPYARNCQLQGGSSVYSSITVKPILVRILFCKPVIPPLQSSYFGFTDLPQSFLLSLDIGPGSLSDMVRWSNCVQSLSDILTFPASRCPSSLLPLLAV